MKLLHHSQGYSQYTFIQKYRISHTSHSGLNRHWSTMWAWEDRATRWDPLPVHTNNNQSGSGMGVFRGGGGQRGNTGSWKGNTGGIVVRKFVQQGKIQQPAFVLNIGALHLEKSVQHATFDHRSSRGRSRASSIEREPFSVLLLNRRQTRRSDHAVVWAPFKRSPAGTTWHSSCLCTLSCNRNTET